MKLARFSLSRAAVLVAVCLVGLLAASPAFAATFSTPVPAANSTVYTSPASVSVAAVASQPILGTTVMTINGKAYPATLAYVIKTPGYWYTDDFENDYYCPPVYDYTKATVSCAPGPIPDGVATAAVTLPNSLGAYSWSFTVSERPLISATYPVAGSTVTTTSAPAIMVKATDNGTITSWNATIDGASVPVTYDVAAGTLKLLAPALTDFASHSAAITVYDAVGNSTSKSWSFTLACPITTFSNHSPAPGAALAKPPVAASVDVTCTSALRPLDLQVRVDSVLSTSAVWISPDPTDKARATVITYDPKLAKNGTHTVAVTVLNVVGTSGTATWSFTVGAPPTLGAPVPAQGSLVTTTSPQLSIPVSTGSVIASWTASVNGSVVPATYSGGVLRLAPAVPNDSATTVTVTVKDAEGLSAMKTWSFWVQTQPDMPGTVTVYDCASCHPGYENDPDMWVKCENCHIVEPSHQGTGNMIHAKADVSTCSPCHVSAITVEHASRTTKAGDPITCMTCHGSTDPAVKAAIASGSSACGGCHSSAGHEAMHTTTVSASCAGSGCHSGTSLTTIHINSGTALTCDSCHKSKDPKVVSAIANHDKSCTACHDATAPHGDDSARHAAAVSPGPITFFDGSAGHTSAEGAGDVSADCTMCHGSTNLITLHGNDCSVCHGGANAPRNSFTSWNKTCTQGNCHPTYHANASAAHDDIFNSGCDCHDYNGIPMSGAPLMATPAYCDCHSTGPDTTAPTTTSDALTSYVGPALITFTADDERGVKSTFYVLDGGAVSTVSGDSIYIPSPGAGSQSHTLEFWSTDWSGNAEAPHHTAFFTVSADTQAPVTKSDAKASYSGPVTIKLTATDNATNRGVKNTYYRFDSGAVQTGSVATMPQPASGTQSHVIHFWSEDYAGNVESDKSASFTVTNDSVAPVTTSDLLPAPKWYPSGKIPMTFTSTDPAPASGVAGVRVTTSNGNAWWGDGNNASFNAANGTWQLAVWAYSSGDYPIVWQATDNAGNVEAPKSVTIRVDAQAPTISCDAVYGRSYTGPQTFTLTASDLGGSGLASVQYRVDSGAWTSGTSVPVTAPVSGWVWRSIFWKATDGAGNVGSGSTSIMVYAPPDTTAPTGSVSLNGGAAWTNSTASTLTVSASDNVAVTQMQFSNDGTNWSAWENYSAATKNWTLTAGDGTKTVYARYKDAAGNVSAVASDTIGLETVAPVTGNDAVGGSTYVGAKTFTLTPSDTGGSGLAGTFWQLDSTAGAWTSGTSVQVAAPSSGSVSHTLYWYSKDNATNKEVTKSVTFTMSALPPDTIAPSGSVSVNGGAAWTNSTASTLTVSASDNIAVTQMQFSNDGTNWSAWENYSAATKNWTLTAGDGTKTVYARYKDAAGNVSAVASDTIGLETVAPVTGSSITAPSDGPGSVTLSASDSGGSGVGSTYYVLTTGGVAGTVQTYSGAVALAAPSTGSAVYSVEYWSVDKAGNAETSHKTTGNITINATIGRTTLSATLTTNTSNHAYAHFVFYDENMQVVADSGWTQDNHTNSFSATVLSGHSYTMFVEWEPPDYETFDPGSASTVVTAEQAAAGATVSWVVNY